MLRIYTVNEILGTPLTVTWCLQEKMMLTMAEGSRPRHFSDL